MSAANYVPYRFYRLCPEDSHTCTARECLAGSPECPVMARAAAKQSTGGAANSAARTLATSGKRCPHGNSYFCASAPCSTDGTPQEVNP